MSFLNPGLLPSLVLLLGLPLFIHLLNLRFPRLFEFSAVKQLRQTAAQRSRFYRWRHRLLLLLRTLCILALLLAFLGPLRTRFGSSDGAKDARSVIVVLDHSLSMEYQSGGATARQRAQTEAAKILDGLEPNDAVNIVLAGAAPQSCFFELSKDHAEAQRFVKNLKPAFTRADFSQANALAARLLAGKGERPEVYYVSDFQRKSWSNVNFTALPPQTRIFFVDVGAAERGNHGILGVSLNQQQLLAGDTVPLEIEVGNYRAAPLQESLQAVIDGKSTFEKEISVAPWSAAKFTLPVAVGGPGLHLCEVSLPPDGLPQDDRFCLTLPVLDKEGVLLVSDAPEPGKDAALYLKTAFNPYEDLAGSILPEQIRAAQLDAGRLAAVRKIFLTRCGPLNADTANLLAGFLFHGGGLVYFLDGETDAANLALLERAMGAPLPLKIGPKRIAKNLGSGAQQILRGEFNKSRFLRLFRGAGRQDLALLEFYDITEATATGAGQILLTYADDTPAMAVVDHGLGTMLLMNFSVSEFSSNLARQRLFPAWMQEIIKNLASDEPAPNSSVAGEIVAAEVWKRELQDAPLLQPSGARQMVATESMGERVALNFVPEELGFYSMRTDKLLHAFAVNASAEESDLRRIDRGELPDQASASGKHGYFVEGREDFQQAITGKPIFHWFIYTGLALLLAEQLVQLRAAKRT